MNYNMARRYGAKTISVTLSVGNEIVAVMVADAKTEESTVKNRGNEPRRDVDPDHP